MVTLSNSSLVSEGGVGDPSIRTEKEAEGMEFQIILTNIGEEPGAVRVFMIASHLIVSNVFFISILRKHLFGVLFLSKS